LKGVTYILVSLLWLTTSLECATAMEKRFGSERELFDAKDCSSCQAPLAATTELKIVSRKSVYRMDELISIDLALLNTTNNPLFVPKLRDWWSIELVVRSDAGERVKVRPYVIAQYGLTADSYELLEPKTPSWGESLLVLAGCGSTELREYYKARDKLLDEEARGGNYPYETFRLGVFASFGDACLDLRPGTYSFTVTATSDYVVRDRKNRRVRTAVGDVASNSLMITIAE
jgi:hypothetical protein